MEDMVVVEEDVCSLWKEEGLRRGGDAPVLGPPLTIKKLTQVHSSGFEPTSTAHRRDGRWDAASPQGRFSPYLIRKRILRSFSRGWQTAARPWCTRNVRI